MWIGCYRLQWVFALVALVALVAVCGASAQPRVDALSQAFDRLVTLDRETFELPPKERRQRLADAYDAAFAPLVDDSPGLVQLPPAGLETLAQATHKLAYYTDDTRYLQRMIKIMDALGSSAGPGALKQYHEVLLQFRRFGDAQQLARRHPGLEVESVPDEVAADSTVQPNAYVIEQGKNRLREAQVPLRGDTLVVIVHPHCGFSLRAMDDLRNNPLLRGVALV